MITLLIIIIKKIRIRKYMRKYEKYDYSYNPEYIERENINYEI